MINKEIENTNECNGLPDNLNLAYYTYFYGSNNNIAFKIPQLPSLKYKCYYYTNNESMLKEIENTGWIGIYDNKPTHDDLIESNMTGKHIKSMPQEYDELKEYDYLCFLDSKLVRINEELVENHINEYFIKQNYALLLKEHPIYNDNVNVWREYSESMHQERYVIEKDKYQKYINHQISKGLSETTEKHCCNGFLLRNMKHDKIIQLNTTWYNDIQECGIQDQISFFFCKTVI